MHLTQWRKGFARAAPVVVVISAVILQWYGHQGGLLQTGDSCHYLSAAKSFKTDLTLLAPDGTAYTYFPPLFPIVLSFLGPYWEFIQMVLGVGCLVLMFFCVNDIIEDKEIGFVCFGSIALSVHLLMIGVFLWSELLFLFLLLLFIRSLEKNFIAAIILGFFLCLQRNAGIFFVIGAALYYWDLKRSILLFTLSSSGLIAWNIYAGIAGEHQYFLSAWHNINVIATEMMHIIAPIHGVALVVVIGVLIYFLKTDLKTRLLSIMTITYLLALPLIFRFEAYDADRYVAVIVPFFMILIFRAFEIAVSKQTSVVRKVLIIVAFCWLAYPVARTVKNASQWHNLSFTSYFCAIQF